MREDPGVDVFFFVATLVGLLGASSEAYRRGPDDANWEFRWRGLDPGYRDWLAAMTTSRTWLSTLDDPEEIELAKGFARRERRRRGHFDVAALALIWFCAALVLAGVLPTSACTLGFSVYGVVRLLAEFGRNQQLKRRLDQRTDPDVAPTRQDTVAA
jgi:hypothetical protein